MRFQGEVSVFMKIENDPPSAVKHAAGNLYQRGAAVLNLHMLLQFSGQNPLIRGHCGGNEAAAEHTCFF